MALDSQTTLIQSGSDLTGKSLVKNIFANGVKWHVRAESVTAQTFKKAQYKDDYKLSGSYLEGAAQLSYRRTAMGTDRKLPNHLEKDVVRWKTTPVRRYDRIARDPLAWARASGSQAAFQDMGEYTFDMLWESWARMEVQHAVGDSRGYLATGSSRTSATIVVVKDGYGHVGTDPLLHLEEGQAVAWLDASNAFAVGGAAKISSIARSTNTITFASAFDDGVTTFAAGDPIVMATTGTTTDGHFKTEYNLAPHGLMGIIDPDAVSTTHLNISESTYFRWKPFREASATFDHWEVQEHFRQLAARSTSPVGPQTHLALCNAAVTSELARTMGGYQQQANLGQTLEGGYQAVRIGNMDFAEDPFLPHDILFTVCKEDLYRADLEGDADFYDEDGSMWSRLADEDADEAFVKEYMQTWSDRRNRHGALTGITLANVSATDYSPSTR